MINVKTKKNKQTNEKNKEHYNEEIERLAKSNHEMNFFK